MQVRFWGGMAGSGSPAHWSKIRSQNVPAISPCMGKTPNMIYCYQDPACITVRPVRRFTSWMLKRMNIASLILLIFTMLHVLWTKWITFIFFSVQWLLEISLTPQTLISIRFMHRSKVLPNMSGAVLLKLSTWPLFLICCIGLPVVKKNGVLVHLYRIVIALSCLPSDLQPSPALLWKKRFAMACRFCYYQLVKPARLPQLVLPALLHKLYRKLLQV